MPPLVFTTLRAREGRPWLWPAHLERLREGAARFGAPPPPEDLLERVRDKTRGIGDARGRVGLGPPDPLVEARPYVEPLGPWTLSPVEAPWSPGEDTMRWKTTARDGYDRARAAAGGADDALLTGPGGAFLETTVANVFFVMQDGGLRTPPESQQILPGVARAAVLREAAALGIPAREAACGLREAAAARECFVSNALLLAWPVASIEGVARYREGPVARRLRERLLRTALPPRIIR